MLALPGRGVCARVGERTFHVGGPRLLEAFGDTPPDVEGTKRYPPRRWVVERALAWLSKCRAIPIRYDKKARNYLALLQLACGLLWYRWHQRLAVLR